MVAARRLHVDEVLDDRRDDHAHTPEGEPGCDPLDGREAPASPGHRWVDDLVEDGDEDQEREGVEVVDHVVGDAVEFHRAGLRDQIVCHLVVHEPVHGQEDEDTARRETAADLVDPRVVEGHEFGFVQDTGWLGRFPQLVTLKTGDQGFQVESPVTLQDESDQEGGLVQDIPGWWPPDVFVPAPDHDDGREQEQNGGQEEGQPEADILLGIHHGDLACESTDVDEEVVSHVDPRDGQTGVVDDSFSSLLDNHGRPWIHGFILFGDERGDVAFEKAHSYAEKDQSQAEDSKGCV